MDRSLSPPFHTALLLALPFCFTPPPLMATESTTFIQVTEIVEIAMNRRAALKARINQLCGSQLVEEKSYAAY